MGIKEILSNETDNTSCIILHKEGLFWRCYEKSAYLFIKNIKTYHLTKKYYKNVAQEVVYLGFPDSVLNEILSNIDNEMVRVDKQITINGFEYTASHYEKWKSNINSKVGGAASSPSNNNVGILQRIASFDILNKTPFECQQFLVTLQRELKDGTVQ